MIGFARRAAWRLAAGDRRLAAWMSRDVRDEDGFVLLETLVAIALISVVMAAFTTFFVNSVANTNQQRATQVATQLANSAVDQIRSLPASDVLLGRDQKTVADQFADGNASTYVKPWLQDMASSFDSTAAVNAGATATIPTTALKQTVNNVVYNVNSYLGTCLISTEALLQASCAKASDLTKVYTSYLRAVVAVTWTGAHCGSVKCAYVTSTLLSPASDPTFNLNQIPPSVPSVINPGDQVSTVGTTVRLQLALAANTGVPIVTWLVTSGVLPNGLGMTQSGLISGVPTVVTPATPITVTATDGLGRPASATFNWTVVAAPTIVTPANQTTAINTSVSLPVVATCPNTPCTYSFSNAPVGLSIDPSTGLITGKPTTAGTVSVTVTVTDDDGMVATSNPFTWAVVSPASVCVQSVALPNGSFEATGVVSGAPNWMVGGSSPLQWDTTEADNVIELWGNGGNSQSNNGGFAIAAQDGTTWAELNANDVGALYQNLTTVPGQVLQWSVWHRARAINGTTAGRDVMQVQIGTPTSTTPQVPTGQTTAMISDDASAWVRYTGVYTVPAGQTTTRFQFAAISTASGDRSIGNFIDNLALNNNIACLTTAVVDRTSTVGTAIAPVQISVDRGTGPFVWGGGASLPAGLYISTSGQITGTPTTVGQNSVTLTFSDATAFTQTVSFNWTVAAKPTIVTPANQTHSVGGSVNLQLSSVCFNSPCSYALNNGPSGLSIDGNGRITGIVTGTATVFSPATVTVTDAAGATATTGNFTWTVLAAPTITTPAAQTAGVGAAVNLAVGSTCPNAPCTFTLANAPPGLTINANTGTITGSPTMSGTYAAVTVTITDKAGSAATTANFTWTVPSAPTIVTPANQTTSVGAPVNLTVASICANPACTYTLVNAPSGLSINGSGVITGSPTLTGTYATVTVKITDRAGTTATTANFTWTVLAAPTVTSPGNQTSSVGSSVSVQLATTCANPGCSYVVNGGPPGLSVSASGKITGTITGSAQLYSPVSVTVTDVGGSTATTATFTWTVVARPTVTSPGNQTSSVGSSVSVQLATTCANPGCSYVVNGGPPGLSVSASGKITGTITGSAQLYSPVSVTVTDVGGSTATTATFTWNVLAAPTVVTPAAQTTTVGASVNLAVGSTCANPSCTFTLANAPSGLSINATSGVITGSPTLTGTYTAVTVTVTDQTGSAATSGSFTWTVLPAPTVTKPADQASTIGTAVNLTVGYTCSNTPCTFALAGAPAGLSINTSTGVITGSPTTAGTSASVTVTITDKGGTSNTSGPFTWTVYARPTVTAPGNQTSSVGASVNLTLTKSCPNAPCSYVLNNGPGGLTITGAGVVTGTVTGPAQVFSNVTVTINDNSGASAASGVFSWTVVTRPTVTAPANQTDSVGAPVNVTLTKSCTNTPCSYVLSNGPGGLTITNAGVVTGTITGSAQVFNNVTVTITDSLGYTAASAAFTWTVLAAPTLTTPGAQKTTVGAPASLTVASTCANPACSLTLAGAPPGLSISNSGVITGTPTTTGTYTTVRVTITDVDGSTAATANFSWTVVGPPTITSPGSQTLTVNQGIAFAIPYTCPNSPCAFTTVNIPPGLTVDNQGNVGGAPTTVGTYSGVTITVTDASGVRATTGALTVTVIGPPSAPTAPAATGGSAQIAVSWSAPTSTNGSAITGYTATSSPGGATCSPSPATATTCTITGLQNATTYTITITATNAQGTGPPSSAVTATTTASCTTSAVGTPATNAFLAYPFNEAAGLVAADVSTNARAGTYSPSGITYGVAGPCPRDGGKAVTLNGSSGAISSNVAPVNPQVFSVAIWFKATVAGGKLIGLGNTKTGASSQYDRHIYMTNAGTLEFGVYPNGAAKTIVSPLAYNNGTWHQAIATVAPSTDPNPGMRLYVDGKLVASDATTTAAEPVGTTSYWRIGYDNTSGWPDSPTNSFFTGSLAFAATYTYALTPAQALVQYNAGT